MIRHHSTDLSGLGDRRANMQFQVCLLLSTCLGLISADGLVRAPYLPSGWRPNGPAFELPTETKKLPFKATTDLTSEIESEGSSFLKEYGPPNFIQDLGSPGKNAALTEDSITNSYRKIEPIKDSVSTLVEEQITEQILVPEDVLQDLTVQALPDVEPNLDFRKVPEEIEEANGRDLRVEDFRVIVEENEQRNTEISENENFGAITQTEEELNEYISKVQENENKVEQVLGDNENIAEISQKQYEPGEANYEVLLVNNQDDVRSAKKEEDAETSDGSQSEEVVLKTISDPRGFQEYGPPDEDKNGAIKDSEYVAPSIELVRETRWTRLSPGIRKLL